MTKERTARTTRLLRWCLWGLPVIVFTFLMATNFMAWSYSRELGRRFAMADSQESARRLAFHIEYFAGRHLSELERLGERLSETDRPETHYARWAARVFRTEPHLVLVASARADGSLFAEALAPGREGMPEARALLERLPQSLQPGRINQGAATSIDAGTDAVLLVLAAPGGPSGDMAFYSFLDAVPLVQEWCRHGDLGDQAVGLILPGGRRLHCAYPGGQPASTETAAPSVRKTFSAANGSWTITTAPRNTHLYAVLKWGSNLRMGVGIVLSALTALLVWAFIRALLRSRLDRQDLHETGERLSLALRAAEAGIWDFYPRSGRLFLNEEWPVQPGDDTKDFPAALDASVEFLHPGDRERIAATLARHLAGDDAMCREEFRYVSPGGGYRWGMATGRVIQRDERGFATRMTGTFIDTTAQKRAEAIREYLALIVENSEDAIIGLGLDGSILSWNAGAAGVFGYEEEEVIGQPLSMLAAPRQKAAVDDLLQDLTEGAAVRGFHAACMHRDARAIDVSVTVSPIRDASGEVIGASVIGRDITEQRQVERALRESQENLARAQAVAQLGSWRWSFAANKVNWSDEMYRIFGLKPNQIHGSRLDAILTRVHPEDQPAVLESLRTFAEGHKPCATNYRIIRTDGAIRHLRGESRLVSDENGNDTGVIGTIQDITEQVRAQEALRQETQRAQHYLDSANVIMLALDAGQRISLINPKACRILGYAESELLGKNWIDLCLPENIRDDMRRKFELLLAGDYADIADFENIILTRSGEERMIRWHNSPLRDEAGHINGVLSSGEDITEQRRAEEEARLREKQLMQADKMASLGILVSGVAHEINNPNAYIMSNISTLRDVWNGIQPILDEYGAENPGFVAGGIPYETMRERIPRLFESIQGGAQRIKLTVQELRGFAQREPDGMIEPVSLNEVLDSAVTLLGNMIRKSTEHFVRHSAPNLPRVQGSFRKLEQVAINLIQNACQALPDRNRTLRLTTAHEGRNGMVVLRVEDEGVGMDAEALPKITDPFYTTKRDTGGTGLGLSICATIVREHKGELKFHSQPGKGTRVEMRLPISNDSNEKAVP